MKPGIEVTAAPGSSAQVSNTILLGGLMVAVAEQQQQQSNNNNNNHGSGVGAEKGEIR